MRIERLSRLDDFLGGPLCLLLQLTGRMRRNGTRPGTPRHAVVAKLRGIGDTILAMPMISFLRQSGCRITFVSGPENHGWLKEQREIDDLVIIDYQIIWKSPAELVKVILQLRKMCPDAWFDLTQSAHFPALLAVFSGAPLRIGFSSGNRMKKNKNQIYTHAIDFNDRKHIADCYFDLLRPLRLSRPASLSLKSPSFSKHDKNRIDSFLALSGCGDRPLVGIHASGPIKAKRWPLSGWRRVCDHLIDRGYRIIAVGGEGERERVEHLSAGLGRRSSELVNAAEFLTLPQLFALMPRLRFFLANDGGPMHIAAAFGIPTLGLFGAETPRRYAPINKLSLALYRGERFPCSPCCKPYAGSWPVCRRPLCLEAITPHEVIEAVSLIEKGCRNFDRVEENA